jgi:hypothetical protein
MADPTLDTLVELVTKVSNLDTKMTGVLDELVIQHSEITDLVRCKNQVIGAVKLAAFFLSSSAVAGLLIWVLQHLPLPLS